MTGVYDQSGRFVHDKDVAVFVYYIERYVLGYYFEFVAWSVHHHLHHVERLDAVVAFHAFAVDEYAAGVGSLLHAVARRLLEARNQKFVDTKELLSFVGHEAEMFKILGAVVFQRFTAVVRNFVVGGIADYSIFPRHVIQMMMLLRWQSRLIRCR